MFGSYMKMILKVRKRVAAPTELSWLTLHLA